MDLAKIKEILDADSTVFKKAIRTTIHKSVARRRGLRIQISELLGLDGTREMSEQDFFTVLDEYNKISGNLSAVLDQAGFDVNISSLWLAKKDAPLPEFRRPTAQMLLGVVVDLYANNQLFHDMFSILEEWDHLGTTAITSEMARSELLSKRVDDFDEYYSLSVRVRNMLKNSQVVTLGELVSMTELGLLRIPNFGRKSLNETIHFLNARGLTLGSLNEAEKEEVTNRRCLNENAGKPLVTKWRGGILPEYKNVNSYTRQQLGEDIYEMVKPDQDLIDALKDAGITYRTQLATAPWELVNRICDGHNGWGKQLLCILNPRNPSRTRIFSLKLGTPVPSHLNEDVQVYKGS